MGRVEREDYQRAAQYRKPVQRGFASLSQLSGRTENFQVRRQPEVAGRLEGGESLPDMLMRLVAEQREDHAADPIPRLPKRDSNNIFSTLLQTARFQELYRMGVEQAQQATSEYRFRSEFVGAVGGLLGKAFAADTNGDITFLEGKKPALLYAKMNGMAENKIMPSAYKEYGVFGVSVPDGLVVGPSGIQEIVEIKTGSGKGKLHTQIKWYGRLRDWHPQIFSDGAKTTVIRPEALSLKGLPGGRGVSYVPMPFTTTEFGRFITYIFEDYQPYRRQGTLKELRARARTMQEPDRYQPGQFYQDTESVYAQYSNTDGMPL